MTGHARSKKSSSIHSINADRELSPLQNILYRVFNICNNLFPNVRVDARLRSAHFVIEDVLQHGIELDHKSSPSRFLSNLFWKMLPWQRILAELNEIRILDIGCGSGTYAETLAQFLGGTLSKYTGLDVASSENWRSLMRDQAHFSFAAYDGRSLLHAIPRGTNFIMSQSALEHIEEDLGIFRQINEYIESFARPVLQIHLFPSKACRRLYPWHGIRQYNPRTVSKLLQVLGGDFYAILFTLGGKACNKLHYTYITKPFFREQRDDLRYIKPAEYAKELEAAVLEDMQAPTEDPSFYALVIHHNFTARIFT